MHGAIVCSLKSVPLNAIVCQHWLAPVRVLIHADMARHSAYPHSRSATNLSLLPPLCGEIICSLKSVPLNVSPC